MHPALDPASYRLTAASIPFWLASAGLLALALYVAFVRGAPALRAAFLGILVTAIPFVAGYGLNACTADPEVAGAVARWCVAFTPMSGAFVVAFDLALCNRLARRRGLLAGVFAVALAVSTVAAVTDWVTAGARATASGVLVGRASTLGFLPAATVGAFIAIGGLELVRALDAETSALRRRQYKDALWAFGVAALGGFDSALSYGYGWYPMSWLFVGIAAVIALRALVAHDLIRSAAIDPRAFRWAFVFAAAGVGTWFALGAESPAVAAAAASGVFLGTRAVASLVAYVAETPPEPDTPQERALARYAERARAARTVDEIGAATRDLFESSLGARRVYLIVPSERDYSWSDDSGDVLVESATPDPLLVAWFADRSSPIARDELVAARLGDMRDALERLFDVYGAEIVSPLVSGDEVVGLLMIGGLPGERALRPVERDLVVRASDHARAAVVYARMVRETRTRVDLSKEVELAAAVQEAFVAGRRHVAYAGVELAGLYAPASRCGGDWWSSYALPDGRVLVVVGDVTGHGVAAAMVTAAAKGCTDVAVRVMGGHFDVVRLLDLLHRAVRRVGGDSFHMTCFATLCDVRNRSVTFANAGHVVPYLIRSAGGRVRLDVLVARGNPLGSTGSPEYVAHTRAIAPGDVLVWYTDGVVECTNPAGELYGDRRFQRALRRIGGEGGDVDAMLGRIAHEVAMHQAGQPAVDDITLVVGRVT